MRNKLCMCLVFLVGATFCDLQPPLVIADSPPNVVSTAKPVKLDGGYQDSSVDPADMEFALVDGKWVQTKTVQVAAVVHVDAKAEAVRVFARRVVQINGIEFVAADVVKAIPLEQQKEGARCYGLVGPLVGKKYQIQIDSYEPSTKAWGTEFLVLELGEPDPEPDPDNPDPPGPDPDVPDDEFDNIGQRVAEWSKGLPKRTEVGALYLSVATELAAGEIVSINDASKKLVEGTREILSTEEVDKWKPFAAELQKDLNDRWPLQRQLYVEYIKAVAKGLGAQ